MVFFIYLTSLVIAALAALAIGIPIELVSFSLAISQILASMKGLNSMKRNDMAGSGVCGAAESIPGRLLGRDQHGFAVPSAAGFKSPPLHHREKG